MEHDARIDRAMLRQKELEDMAEHQRLEQERSARFAHKNNLQEQMVEREHLREQAWIEYEREKQNVEQVVN